MRALLNRISVALFLTALPALSLAATCDPTIPGIQCPLEADAFTGPEFITSLINKVSNWMFTFLLALAVTFIVIAAYKYLFSGGSEESVSAAHKMMLYAAVAVAVALLSRGFVVVVRSLITTSAPGSSSSTTPPPGTPPPAAGSPVAAPVPVNYRIIDDASNTVTLAMLPATSISIYTCTQSDGSRWTPAFRFTGAPGVTRLQGGCSGLCSTHEARYGGFESYPLGGGIEISMERCSDGTSPRFLFNGASLGGTP